MRLINVREIENNKISPAFSFSLSSYLYLNSSKHIDKNKLEKLFKPVLIDIFPRVLYSHQY